MRADRLLSILLLLQARGPRKLTAGQLARELEVSERTVYRDIDALSAAGVPVYGEAGPAGGYALLDSYRTTLTGLTGDETRALFMLSIPDALAELGLSQQLRSALLKLSAALPAARRDDEAQVRQRFYLDSAWWRQVVKAGVWHLVAAVQGALRVYPLARLSEARLAEGRFRRPAEFDLEAFWRGWCSEQEQGRDRFVAVVRVAPHFISELARRLGEQTRRAVAAGAAGENGWITATLPFESLEAARERILSFGGGVEVLEPPALRWSVQDFAAQIAALYGR